MGVELIILNPWSFCFGWCMCNENDDGHIMDIYLGFFAIGIYREEA